jgi:hypothetical protein
MTPEAGQKRFDAIVRTAVPDVPIHPRDVLNKSPVGEQLITGKIDRYWAPGRCSWTTPRRSRARPRRPTRAA